MNKEKAKILNKALEMGSLPEGCNDPELLALFKAGGHIKNSSFNNSVVAADFKDRLKRDILAKRQTNAFSMKDKISRFFENLHASLTTKRLYPAVAAFLLIVIVTATFKFWPNGGFSPLSIEAAYAHDNFTVETSSGDDMGIETDTQFVIKSKTAISDVESLKANIKLSPEVDFDLKKISDKEFKLTPNKKLTDKTVYRLVIASTYINDNNLTVDYNYSWAFQVKDKFKVVGSTPTNSSSAPANTGIEIIFSTENFEGFEDAFSISPATPGKFEKHGRTMVFVPEKPLTVGSLYSVKINPSVKNSNTGEVLENPYSFQFEVQNSSSSNVISFLNDTAEFSTSQNPAFGIYINNEQKNNKISTKVYNFHSLDDFSSSLKKYYEVPYWATNARRDFKPDYSNLSLAATYEIQAVVSDNGSFLVLPNNLPAGFYLIESTIGGTSARTFVQVSNISAYTTITSNKIMFWVNSVAGKELSDIKVTNLETKEVTTAKNNVATFEYNVANKNSIFVVSSAKESLVINASQNYSSYNSSNNKYWSYLYTDRSLYQPTDEINFWGMVKTRANNRDTFNREVTVTVLNHNYLDFYQSPVSVSKQVVKTDEQGFFMGKLKLNNLTPNSYYIKVQMDGEDLSSEYYIDVQNYIKPAYQLEVTSKSKAVFTGDKINYQIKNTFFEGTALANNVLTINHLVGNDRGVEQEVTTGSDGVATASYISKCSCFNGFCSASCSDYLTATPKLAEGAQIIDGSEVFVFRSHVKFANSKTSQVAGKNRARIETDLYNVDLNNEEKDWNGAPASNQEITAQIVAIEYVPYQTGTYYDFINKVSYPMYRYDMKRTVQPDQKFVTDNNGKGVLEFEVNPKYSYEIKLAAFDKSQNVVNDSLYFSALSSNSDPRYKNYYFKGQQQYGVGETVNLTVSSNGEPLTEKGKFLFMHLQNGLQSHELSDKPETSFTFKEQDIPNIFVNGAWFDGHTYYPISGSDIYFKNSNKKLDITVKANQEKYNPGNDVVLNISVKDKDKRGVKTHVNVSAVDIAMDPLGGISFADPIADLYKRVYSGLLSTQSSHKNQMFGGGAEGGGGGDNSRSYFPDLAVFTQVETNSNGEAVVKFKLPDTVTSWQVNTQAISADLEAGATTTKLVATLPFFATVNFSKQYVAGDEPIIKAAVFGDALKATDKLDINLEAQAIGLKKDAKNVSAFSSAYFDLGKLNSGNFEFKVGSSYKNNSDQIINKITVVDSLLSERFQVTSELKNGSLISGSEKNWTTITLMDNNRGRYYQELLNLSYSDGARVDQKLSAAVSNKLMSDYFGLENNKLNSDLKIYQTEDGGVSLLPYSSSDLKLSVLAAMTAPESFDKNSLAQYFYKVYDSKTASTEELSLALSGLAALNEPVLISLRGFSKTQNLAPMDKIYLALGAQLIGDNNLAQTIYNELIIKYGEEFNSYERLKIDTNNDNNSMATALVSALAAGLDDSRAEKLWSYANDNQPQDSLTNLERLLYLRNVIPTIAAGDSKFVMTLDGEETNKDLKRGEKYLFAVSPEQLKTLNIQVVSGNILAISDYDVLADVSKQNQAVKISKTYFNKNKKSLEFKEGDIVEIHLKPELKNEAIDGSYEITDILPSGLKLLTNVYSRGLETSCNTWYPYEVQGQKVKFIIDKNWNKSGNCNREDIKYFARVSQPGKYVIESALIQSVKSTDVKSFSDGGQINISY